MHSRYPDLLRLAQLGYNVLMIADHGIGKSTMTFEIADTIGYKLKAYSAPTMDPFTDLVGVPVPRGEEPNEYLKLIRPKDIDQAEMLLIDELNRAHPKTVNALMEVIQFHTINGEPLPKLKMVWACINSHVGGKFVGVSALDPAVVDRFHGQVELKAEPTPKYYVERCGIDQGVASTLVDWWKAQPAEVQFYLTPRRLEYMGKLIKDGLDPTLGKPFGVEVSMASLKTMLRSVTRATSVDVDALNDPQKRKDIIARMQSDHAMQIEIAKLVEGIRMNAMLDYNDVVREFRPEVRFEFFRRLQGKIKNWFPSLSTDVGAYKDKFGERAAAAAEFVTMYKACGLAK